MSVDFPPVFAQEYMHLSGNRSEVHGVQRQDAGEGLVIFFARSKGSSAIAMPRSVYARRVQCSPEVHRALPVGLGRSP